MSTIHPIGNNPLPPAYYHAAAIYSRYSLADVLAFRWRTCGKLGFFDYCDDDRYEPSRGLVAFADYLELRALRIAAQRIELDTASTVNVDMNRPQRFWPFHLPLGGMAQSENTTPEQGHSAIPPGTFLDIVF